MYLGLPWWFSESRTCLQGGRPGFDPWIRAWQPTPVFLPGESPWTEEPRRLQSMGSQRVGHNWATFTHTHTHIMYLSILESKSLQVFLEVEMINQKQIFLNSQMILTIVEWITWNTHLQHLETHLFFILSSSSFLYGVFFSLSFKF